MDRETVRMLIPAKKSLSDEEAYRTIRDECFKRIEHRARDGHEYCFYTVPKLHWTLLPYNASEMFTTLYAELEQGEFQLIAWPAQLRIFIGWFESTESAMSNIPNIPLPFQDVSVPQTPPVPQPTTPFPQPPPAVDDVTGVTDDAE